MRLLDDLLPEYHFSEHHSVRVDASPERALAAIKEVTLAESPLVQFLFRVRGLPVRPGSIYAAMVAAEFELLGEKPGREIVLGAVGRPWTPHVRFRRGIDFRSFAEPGYAKMAIAFVADGHGLATETRVLLTDPRSLRKFRRYWLVIRPFSGLIRRSWLRAARRRAERSD